MEGQEASYYADMAKRLVKALCDRCAVKSREESNGLLLHGTYARDSAGNPCCDRGVDECSTCLLYTSGIMVVLNCGIGLLTPPVGAVLFIGSAVSKVPMERVVKATLPFYLCMIITLLLITFVPASSLWLPQVLAQ